MFWYVLFIFFKDLFFIHVFLYLHYVQMYVGAYEGQIRAQDLEAEFQAFVRFLLWVLRTELKSSARVESNLICRATSLASSHILYQYLPLSFCFCG